MKPPTGAGTAAKRKSQKSKSAKEELLTPSHDEAKELYRLAQQLGICEPWQWMEEIDLFGVQDPATDMIGFVSVMGMRGEYRAIAVYLGEEGLRGWFDFESALQLDPKLPDAASLLLEIPHLHVSFSDPDQFEKRDRDLLKGVGLKFNGGRPLFRSSRPGYLPWFITREEARLLIPVLSQMIIIAERLLENPNILHFEKNDQDASFLVRVSREQGSVLVWEDRIRKFSLRRPQLMPLVIEPAVLNKLKLIPQSQLEIEADLFMAPGAVGKRSERPLALFTLLLADYTSGFICGVEATTAEQGLTAMYAGLPNHVARLLLEGQLLPKRLRIRSDRLSALLTPLARELNIELLHASELPAIEEARNFMLEHMR